MDKKIVIKALILLIGFYQVFISPILKQFVGMSSSCRFIPTCSEYAKEMIKREGSTKGGFAALLRFLQCQPFGIMNHESGIKKTNNKSVILNS